MSQWNEWNQSSKIFLDLVFLCWALACCVQVPGNQEQRATLELTNQAFQCNTNGKTERWHSETQIHWKSHCKLLSNGKIMRKFSFINIFVYRFINLDCVATEKIHSFILMEYQHILKLLFKFYESWCRSSLSGLLETLIARTTSIDRLCLF